MQTMAETATETITIAAPPEQVWQIATDLERYPQWARDVKGVPDGEAEIIAAERERLGFAAS